MFYFPTKIPTHHFRSFFTAITDVQRTNKLKVVICGAAGKIGQKLSLFLKQSPYINELTLFDVRDTYALHMDLSHINTKCRVKAFTGLNEIEDALVDANIIAVCIKSDEHQDDHFETNANIIMNLMLTISDICPEAFIGIVTNPLNSIVPVAFNIMNTKIMDYPTTRLFGINSIDVVRANSVAANVFGLKSERVEIPIIGGHSKDTIVPLFSQIDTTLKKDLNEKMVQEVRDACEHNLLATSFATARFVSSLAMVIKTNKSIIDCAYVRSNILPEIKYCSIPLELSGFGIEKYFEIPHLSELENQLFQKAQIHLKQDIQRGESYFLKMNKIKQELHKI